MRNWIFSAILLTSSILTFGQTAKMQFLHNGPDPANQLVNIFINGQLVRDSLAFRTSTAFISQPADTTWRIHITGPEALDTTAAWTSFDWTPVTNGKYIAVIHGVPQPNQYPNQELISLRVLTGALEQGSSPSGTDFLFFQGCADCGNLSMIETQLIQLPAFQDVAYGGFGSYLSLFAADFSVDVSKTINNELLGSFTLPFASNAWGGKSVSLIASGYLNQSTNNNGPAFGLFASLSTGGPWIPMPAQSLNLFANIQVVHDLIGDATQDLSITVNQQNWVNQLSYHEATDILNIPAGRPIEITLSGQSDTTFWTRTEHLQLASGGQYLWTLQGTADTSDVWPIHSEIRALPVSPTSPDGPAVAILNGLLWNEPLDVIIDTPFEQVIADSSVSGSLSNWTQPMAGAQYVRVKNHLNAETRCAYLWDMAVAPVVQPLYVGQQNPLDSASAVQLFRIPISGGPFTEFPSIPPPPVFTQAQFVHTSADVALAVVDVYANGALLIDNFNQHQVSPVLEVLAEEPWILAVAPGNSTSADEALFTQSILLPEDGQHLLALAGIFSASGYNPAPQAEWKIKENMHTSSSTQGQTDILFFAAATDLGTFDLLDAANTSVNWFDQAIFGHFSEYQSFDAGMDEGILATNGNGSFMYGAWALPISSNAWNNQSVLIYSSGFFNPGNNFNGGPLTFWYATSGGLSGQLPLYVGVDEASLTTFITLYPNPTSGTVHLKANLSRPAKHMISVLDMNGRVVYRDQITGGGMVSKSWDFGNLENGVYVVRMECNQQVESYRFTLHHE